METVDLLTAALLGKTVVVTRGLAMQTAAKTAPSMVPSTARRTAQRTVPNMAPSTVQNTNMEHPRPEAIPGRTRTMEAIMEVISHRLRAHPLNHPTTEATRHRLLLHHKAIMGTVATHHLLLPHHKAIMETVTTHHLRRRHRKATMATTGTLHLHPHHRKETVEMARRVLPRIRAPTETRTGNINHQVPVLMPQAIPPMVVATVMEIPVVKGPGMGAEMEEALTTVKGIAAPAVARPTARTQVVEVTHSRLMVGLQPDPGRHQEGNGDITTSIPYETCAPRSLHCIDSLQF